MPDFDAMSIDEIVAYRVERRMKMRELKEEIMATKEAYERKLLLQSVGAQLRMDISDLSNEDAMAMARIVAAHPRTGDVVVGLEPMTLVAEGL